MSPNQHIFPLTHTHMHTQSRRSTAECKLSSNDIHHIATLDPNFSSTYAASSQTRYPPLQTSVVASRHAPSSSPKPSLCTFQAWKKCHPSIHTQRHPQALWRIFTRRSSSECEPSSNGISLEAFVILSIDSQISFHAARLYPNIGQQVSKTFSTALFFKSLVET